MKLPVLDPNSNYKGLLEDNFKEIYHSVKYPSIHPIPLTANCWGTRVYDSRYGWGRIWRWFYQVLEWATGNDWHLKTLKRAMLHTHKVFHLELAKVQKALNHYLEYLKKCGKGYSVSERHYFSSRECMTKWNNATKPFLKMLQTTSLEKFFPEHVVSELPVSSYCSSSIPALHICQKIIDLEGRTGESLPLAILKKVIREIPPNAMDQKDLDRWLIKIERKNISGNAVHKALHALILFYAKNKEGKRTYQESLASLEGYLEDRGCLVFQQNDVKHLKWRQSLERGTVLPLNVSKIILGKELFPKISGSDKTRAYTVEGRNDVVALIANNCMTLPLRNLRMKKERHVGMEPALFLDLSTDGRVALMERFKAIGAHQWTTKDNFLSKEDKPIIEILSRMIQGFVKQGITPSDFSPSYLMLTEKMELKFLKPSSRKPFDFNAIEDFIFECAAGNRFVFQELMVKSGMASHASAKFYRDVVSNVLNGETTASDDLAGIYRISDPKIVDRAAILMKKVNTLKKRLSLHLREKHPKMLPKRLESLVYQQVMSHYLEFKTAGLLWPLKAVSISLSQAKHKSAPVEK